MTHPDLCPYCRAAEQTSANLSRPKTEAEVLAGFPAVGKSHLAKARDAVIDSDSSHFSRDAARWPSEYLTFVQWARWQASLVLVSTHKEVRAGLVAAGVPFVLVYPQVGLREEYRQRMERRGSPVALIEKVIDELWDEALAGCAAQEGCDHVVLGPGQYLSDAIQRRQDWRVKGHRTNERPRYASGELLIHHSGEAWKVTDRWLPGADAADPSDHAGIFPEDGDYRIESMVTGARIRVHADYLHGDGWRRCT